MYRMRAIITRGLYTFYPIFEGIFFGPRYSWLRKPYFQFALYYIPYARHYNPRFVYFLPTFWKSKTFFQGGFFRKFCPYVWLVFKSGFWSRAGYSGECTVFKSQNPRKTTPYKLGHFSLKIKPKIASRDTQLGSCIVQQFCDGFAQDLWVYS